MFVVLPLLCWSVVECCGEEHGNQVLTIIHHAAFNVCAETETFCVHLETTLVFFINLPFGSLSLSLPLALDLIISLKPAGPPDAKERETKLRRQSPQKDRISLEAHLGIGHIRSLKSSLAVFLRKSPAPGWSGCSVRGQGFPWLQNTDGSDSAFKLQPPS